MMEAESFWSMRVYFFKSRQHTKQIWFNSLLTISMCGSAMLCFQWLSTWTKNIFCGLTFHHIYNIQMRWVSRSWQKAQSEIRVLSKLSFAPLAKGRWPQSYPLQGRKERNGDSRRDWTLVRVWMTAAVKLLLWQQLSILLESIQRRCKVTKVATRIAWTLWS